MAASDRLVRRIACRSVFSPNWDKVRPSLSLCRSLVEALKRGSCMPERVLIIDDEENIRQMIRLTLGAAGYEVGEAEDGIEPFAILGGDPAWNVVLLDQRLRSEEHTSELQSHLNLVCLLLLEKKKQ